MTCIGNSGSLPQEVQDAINANDLVVGAVLSGNRNFEGRVSPNTRANYLASPPLVVAYALAGRVDNCNLKEVHPESIAYIRERRQHVQGALLYEPDYETFAQYLFGVYHSVGHTVIAQHCKDGAG